MMWLKSSEVMVDLTKIITIRKEKNSLYLYYNPEWYEDLQFGSEEIRDRVYEAIYQKLRSRGWSDWARGVDLNIN